MATKRKPTENYQRAAWVRRKQEARTLSAILKWRLECGLSQPEVLAALKKAGADISLPTYSRYEAGKIGRPSPSVVKALEAVSGGTLTFADICPA